MPVIEIIDDQNWAANMQKYTSARLVLFTFGSEWCTSCKVFKAHTLEPLSRKGNIVFTYTTVDVENEESQALQYMRSHKIADQFPSFVLYSGGQYKGQNFGAAPRDVLLKWINSLIKKASIYPSIAKLAEQYYKVTNAL